MLQEKEFLPHKRSGNLYPLKSNDSKNFVKAPILDFFKPTSERENASCFPGISGQNCFWYYFYFGRTLDFHWKVFLITFSPSHSLLPLLFLVLSGRKCSKCFPPFSLFLDFGITPPKKKTLQIDTCKDFFTKKREREKEPTNKSTPSCVFCMFS